MSEPMSIRLADLRQIVQLLGECRELGDDPMVWRQHFNAGLGRLVGAELVMSGETVNILRGEVQLRGGTAWGLDHGFSAAGYVAMGEMFAKDSAKSDVWQAQLNGVRENPTAGCAFSRQELMNDRQWYRSFDYQRISRLLGADAVMASMQPTRGDDHFDGINLSRAPGRAKFSEREVALVRFVHEEAARLIGGALARFEEPSPSNLPPRVRQVLRCLLDGDSDKQIAARLNLSQHTVNQYTKQIYRHFQVSGRVELLARWLRRGWSNRAEWDAAVDSPRLPVAVEHGETNGASN